SLSRATPTTHIYTLSLHDALPISRRAERRRSLLLPRSSRSYNHSLQLRNPFVRIFALSDVDAYQWIGELNEIARRHARVDDFHRSEEHTSELQSRGHLVCRLLLEK